MELWSVLEQYCRDLVDASYAVVIRFLVIVIDIIYLLLSFLIIIIIIIMIITIICGAAPNPQVQAPPRPECDDMCVRLREKQRIPLLITMRKSSEVMLDPNFIASEPGGPVLVLRPGALTQGQTYLLQVTVTSPGEY